MNEEQFKALTQKALAHLKSGYRPSEEHPVLWEGWQEKGEWLEVCICKRELQPSEILFYTQHLLAWAIFHANPTMLRMENHWWCTPVHHECNGSIWWFTAYTGLKTEIAVSPKENGTYMLVFTQYPANGTSMCVQLVPENL